MVTGEFHSFYHCPIRGDDPQFFPKSPLSKQLVLSTLTIDLTSEKILFITSERILIIQSFLKLTHEPFEPLLN